MTHVDAQVYERMTALGQMTAAQSWGDLVEPLRVVLHSLNLQKARITLLQAQQEAFKVFEAAKSHRSADATIVQDPMSFQRGDALTEAVFSRGEAALWRMHTDGRAPASARAKQLIEMGLGEGASVSSLVEPGWRTTLCVVAMPEEPPAVFERRFQCLKGSLNAVIQAVRPLAAKRIAKEYVRSFSAQDLALLAALTRGKSINEIAMQSGVSEASVKAQARHVLSQLKVHSPAQAAALNTGYPDLD